MKKLLLLSALLIFACSSDDSSNTNDNNDNTTIEKRISKLGIHSIQSCDDIENYSTHLMTDSLIVSYSNQDFSFLRRTFEYDCGESEWYVEDYDFWSDVNVQRIGNNLITDWQSLSDNNSSEGFTDEFPLNNDGYIENIMYDNSLLSFEYNNGYLSQINSDNMVSIFTWQNNNLQNITQNGVVGDFEQVTYNFDYSEILNKSNLFGGFDYWGTFPENNIFDPLFGKFCGNPSSNLPTKITRQRNDTWIGSDTTTFDYEYTLDNEGYVMFITISLNIIYNHTGENFEGEFNRQWTLEIEYTN